MTTTTPEVHKLQHTWVLWEHVPVDKGATADQWSKSMTEVCEFSTVEEFWKYWAFIPRPSEIFSDGQNKKTVSGKTIDTFSMFKKGIKPQWEDKENAKGAEIFLRKTLQADTSNLYWENLVLGVLGETIEEEDEICGCRIVDKTKKGGKDARPLYRFEVWTRTKDEAVISRLKQRTADVMTDGKPKGLAEAFGYNDH